jgi:hypothetical protein
MESGKNAFAVLMRSAASVEDKTLISRKRTSASRGGSSSVGATKKAKGKGMVQLCLDLGQKNFGPKTCSECGMTYTAGVEEDDKQHKTFHARAVQGIPFKNQWKKENVVMRNDHLRIIAVEKAEFAMRWKLLSQVLELVHRDLGGCPVSYPRDYDAHRVFLLIDEKEKRVAGCLVQDVIDNSQRFEVHRCQYIISPNAELPHIKLGLKIDGFEGVGVQKMWVHQNSRRKGLAKLLLTACRAESQQIAFTELTPDGLRTAVSFLGSEDRLLFYTENNEE